MSDSYLIVYNNKYYVLFLSLFEIVELLDSWVLDSVKVEVQINTTEFLKNNFYILLKYIIISDIINYKMIN